jgi:hypothetical protein
MADETVQQQVKLLHDALSELTELARYHHDMVTVSAKQLPRLDRARAALDEVARLGGWDQP